MQLRWPLVAIPLTIWSLNRSSENIIHGIFYWFLISPDIKNQYFPSNFQIKIIHFAKMYSVFTKKVHYLQFYLQNPFVTLGHLNEGPGQQ